MVRGIGVSLVVVIGLRHCITTCIVGFWLNSGLCGLHRANSKIYATSGGSWTEIISLLPTENTLENRNELHTFSPWVCSKHFSCTARGTRLKAQFNSQACFSQKLLSERNYAPQSDK